MQNDELISDAFSPQSIAGTLSYLLDLSAQELENIGEKNRVRAQALFDEELIVGQYLTIFGKDWLVLLREALNYVVMFDELSCWNVLEEILKGCFLQYALGVQIFSQRADCWK